MFRNSVENATLQLSYRKRINMAQSNKFSTLSLSYATIFVYYTSTPLLGSNSRYEVYTKNQGNK